MFQWLLLAAIAASAIAEPVAAPEASAPVPIHRESYHRDDRRRHHEHDHRREGHDHHHEAHDHRRDQHHKDNDDEDRIGPNIVRLFDPIDPIAFDPHNPRHKKIIENVYSPDYYQPTWILDYRYQKSGGRGYTRAEGGQVLILPKNHHNHEKDYTYTNYDELLEFLRLKQLSESQAHRLHNPEHKAHESHHEARDHKEHKENRGWHREPSLRSYH